MTPAPVVRVEPEANGAFLHLILNTPKANLLDRAKIDALSAAIAEAARSPHVKALILSGEGPGFSYGASVEEHLPGQFESMIPAFDRLFLAILDSDLTCIAAVRGQCLGGGMELAAFCQRVIVAPDAKMGQPEIALGVIAPVASAMLAARVGQIRAEELLVTGRIIGADEALRIGLADEIADDPLAAARAWASESLLSKSASSLRLAVRAARAGFAARFRRDLEQIEALYLNDLMATHDAREGLAAFLEKRRPAWSDR